MARASKASKKDDSPAPDRAGRAAQLRQVWSLTRSADPKLPLIVLGPALALLVVLVVVGVLIKHPVYLSILGVLGALVAGMAIFGRRATKAMYAQVEGQPGAGASVLQTLRGEWRTTPAVAFNRNMDLVHRVIGRPGVILIGEGNPAQLRQLIVDQKRRVGRVAPDTPMTRLCRLLDAHGVLDRTELAMPGDKARLDQLLALREAAPTGVNRRVGNAKRDIDARIEKTAADMVVPFESLEEMMRIYRDGYVSRGLDFAIWGHISDGNLHPNVLPRSFDDVTAGKDAILEFGREAARLGGCPLAEHGVGRNPVKQRLLHQMYGAQGIAEMRAIRKTLDPGGVLSPGVLFS